MKTHRSNTANGGQTVILDTAADAIKSALDYLEGRIAHWESQPPGTKVRVAHRNREGTKTIKKAASTFAKELQESLEDYNKCADAIIKGDSRTKSRIAEMVPILRDLAIEIEPSLAVSYHGYRRALDGIHAAPELIAAGEELCCFERRRSGEDIMQRSGDGAYRIIINTDVKWMGNPAENAAMMGALVVLLQGFGPVEIWIQQGWLGKKPRDGVTLFKLDFNGAFDPTALAFWLGHPQKDATFSFWVGVALGRESNGLSHVAEMECDLYLHGHMPTDISRGTNSEKFGHMAKWIADTAMQIVHQTKAAA